MKKLFKSLTSTQEKKTLLENFFALSSLQAANYLLPLITFPYLVRVLGPEKYGMVAFAVAVVQYFVIVTDYGFNLSATREISIRRNDPQKVAEIFHTVLAIKLGLFLLSSAVFAVILVLVPKFRNEWLLYVFSFSAVFASLIFPIWFFQGIERMKYITILNVIGKLFFTVAVFVFIRERNDYLYVPLISSLGSIATGAIGLGVAYHTFKVRLLLPSAASLRYQLREGWHIFISGAAISFYTNSNIVILGFFAHETVVGYFAAAERIARLVQQLLTPASQVLYPYMSKLTSESKERALLFLRKLLFLIGGVTFLLSAGLFVSAGLIARILLGTAYGESIKVLRILAVLPFLTGLSNVFGIQTMLTFGMKKAFSSIILSAGILNLILAFLLTPPLKHIGISISIVVTEFFVAWATFSYIRRRGLLNWHFITTGCLPSRAA